MCHPSINDNLSYNASLYDKHFCIKQKKIGLFTIILGK